MNPVEEFLALKYAALEQKRKVELQHLRTWKKTKNPRDLEPLLQSYAPVLEQKMRSWRAPTVPEPAFRAELQGQLIDAFKTYDPTRGTQLSTHVENRLQKAMRYNARYQNLAYIPEGQIAQITPIQRASEELTENLGRAPTPKEVSEHIGVKEERVRRVLNAQRRDIPASMFESDPDARRIRRDEEIRALLPSELNERERAVFERLYGDQRSEKKKPLGRVAKELGMSPSQFSRVHSSVLQKYKQYR